MSREVTTALLLSVTSDAAQHLAVVIGKKRGKMDEPPNNDRTMVQKAIVGDRTRVSSLHPWHFKGAGRFACRCCERLEMVACDANM